MLVLHSRVGQTDPVSSFGPKDSLGYLYYSDWVKYNCISKKSLKYKFHWRGIQSSGAWFEHSTLF